MRDRLRTLYPACAVELLTLTTRGDQILDRTLSKVGGKGLFVKELENALLDGRADLAVHSLKDVPVDLQAPFELCAVLDRADPRDAFVSNRHGSLADLPAGAVVGTSSLRRESQIRARYPELVVKPLRGNLDTRLGKLDKGEYDAIVLAAAGLERLGLGSRIRSLLDPADSLPAAGQGALGIEIRDDRDDMRAWLARWPAPTPPPASWPNAPSRASWAVPVRCPWRRTPRSRRASCRCAPWWPRPTARAWSMPRAAGPLPTRWPSAKPRPGNCWTRARRPFFANCCKTTRGRTDGQGVRSRRIAARCHPDAARGAQRGAGGPPGRRRLAALHPPRPEIQALPAAAQALPRPADYDMVVFVSGNAARQYLDQWRQADGPSAWPAGVIAATVGPASAQGSCARPPVLA